MKKSRMIIGTLLGLFYAGFSFAQVGKPSAERFANIFHEAFPWYSKADLKECMGTYLTQKDDNLFIGRNDDVMLRCRVIKLYSQTHLKLQTFESWGQENYAVALWGNEFEQKISFGGSGPELSQALTKVGERDQFEQVSTAQMKSALEEFVVVSMNDLNEWKKYHESDVNDGRKTNPKYRDSFSISIISKIEVSIRLAKLTLQAIDNPSGADRVGGLHSLRAAMQISE